MRVVSMRSSQTPYLLIFKMKIEIEIKIKIRIRVK